MANFGVDRLIISAYDGSDIPPVTAGGPRATFAHVQGQGGHTTIKLPCPSGAEVLAYPGRDPMESIGDFFEEVGLPGATVRDHHGALVDARTPHAHAWVDRGQLDLRGAGGRAEGRPGALLQMLDQSEDG
jgi:hypothetical protein